MKQQTLAMAADQAAGFERHRKPTRRDEFLESMDRLVPCYAGQCSRQASTATPAARSGEAVFQRQRLRQQEEAGAQQGGAGA